MTGFDPQEFGKVLARLDSQDRTLARLEQDMHELSESVNRLTAMMCAAPRTSMKKPDWFEMIVGAILGAVCYFVGAKIIG